MLPLAFLAPVIGWGSKLLGGKKGASAAGITLLLGIVFGMWINQKFFAPEPEKITEYITKVVEVQREETRRVETQFIETAAEVRVVEKIVPREVIKYVPVENDTACNTPIGSVRLLNDARSGRLREDSLSSPTGLPDEEGTRPSTVTRRTLTESAAETAIAYNQCKTQLNALIDWIQAQQRSLDQD